MDYSAQQRGYYLKEINRALPTRQSPSTFDPRTIHHAVGTADPATTMPPDVRSLMTEFSGQSKAMAADATCRAMPYPGPAMRDPAARTGCGWWYTNDPATPSVGAYGTRHGPMSPTLDTTFGPGQWIWEPQEAQQLEGLKQAAKIASCADLQFAKMPNMGWCNTTGMALLTDGAGNPLFPRAAGGDCDPSQIVTDPTQCQAPVSPSSSGGGGGAPAAPGIATICTPDANGALSPYCLQQIVGNTCSPSGLLYSSLGGAAYAGADPTFSTMNAILQQRGFEINSGIVNDGRLSMQDAINSVNGIYQLAARNDGSIESNIGTALCFNKTQYDPCNIPTSATGPWDAYASCITTAALNKGYSAQGAIMPGLIDMSYWNQFASWGEVLANLDGYMTAANTAPSASDPDLFRQQAKAQVQGMNNVYGINITFPGVTCAVPPVGV